MLDPFQQWNRYNMLSTNEKFWLRDTLSHMIKCKGSKDCGPLMVAGRNGTTSDVQNEHTKYPSSSTLKTERLHSQNLQTKA